MSIKSWLQSAINAGAKASGKKVTKKKKKKQSSTSSQQGSSNKGSSVTKSNSTLSNGSTQVGNSNKKRITKQANKDLKKAKVTTNKVVKSVSNKLSFKNSKSVQVKNHNPYSSNKYSGGSNIVGNINTNKKKTTSNATTTLSNGSSQIKASDKVKYRKTGLDWYKKATGTSKDTINKSTHDISEINNSGSNNNYLDTSRQNSTKSITKLNNNNYFDISKQKTNVKEDHMSDKYESDAEKKANRKKSKQEMLADKNASDIINKAKNRKYDNDTEKLVNDPLAYAKENHKVRDSQEDTKDNIEDYSKYKYISKSQEDTYYYLMGKKGSEAAEQYLREINPTLEQRKAEHDQSQAEEVQKNTNSRESYNEIFKYRVKSGLESGIKGLGEGLRIASNTTNKKAYTDDTRANELNKDTMTNLVKDDAKTDSGQQIYTDKNGNDVTITNVNGQKYILDKDGNAKSYVVKDKSGNYVSIDLDKNGKVKTDKNGNYSAYYLDKKKEGNLGSFVIEASESVAQQVPQTVLGAVTGMEAVSLGAMAVSSYGSGVKQAQQEGRTAEEAKRFGLGSALKEVGSEKVFGLVPGVNKTNTGLATKVIEKITPKILNNRVVTSLVGDMIEEGGEEFAGDLVEPLVERIAYGTNYDDNGKEQSLEEAYSNLSTSDMLKDFAIGAVSTIPISATGTVTQAITGNSLVSQRKLKNSQVDSFVQSFEQSGYSNGKATAESVASDLTLQADKSDNDITSGIGVIEGRLHYNNGDFADNFTKKELETKFGKENTKNYLNEVNRKRSEQSNVIQKAVNNFKNFSQWRQDAQNGIRVHDNSGNLTEIRMTPEDHIEGNKLRAEVSEKQLSNLRTQEAKAFSESEDTNFNNYVKAVEENKSEGLLPYKVSENGFNNATSRFVQDLTGVNVKKYNVGILPSALEKVNVNESNASTNDISRTNFILTNYDSITRNTNLDNETKGIIGVTFNKTIGNENYVIDMSINTNEGNAFVTDVLKSNVNTGEVIDELTPIKEEIRENIKNANIVNELANKVGLKVEFTNNLASNQNGYITNDTVYINTNSSKGMLFTIGHELVHYIKAESNVDYESFEKVVNKIIKNNSKYQASKIETEETYKKAYEQGVFELNENETLEDYIGEEVVADFIGNVLFNSDEEVMQLIIQSDMNVAQRIASFFKKIHNVLSKIQKGEYGYKEARELLRAEKAFNKAFNRVKVGKALKSFSDAKNENKNGNNVDKNKNNTKWSIQYDEKGPYILIDTEQKIFENARNSKEKREVVKAYLLEKFGKNGIYKGVRLPNDVYARINVKDRNELSFKNEGNLETKQRLITEFKNLYEIAEKVNSARVNTKHNNATYNSFDYYKFRVKLINSDKIVNALINIGYDKADNPHFYDITFPTNTALKKIRANNQTAETSSTETRVNSTINSENIMSQNSSESNSSRGEINNIRRTQLGGISAQAESSNSMLSSSINSISQNEEKSNGKYSISKNFKNDVKAVLENKYPSNEVVKATNGTPKILLDNGERNLPIYLRQSVIKNCVDSGQETTEHNNHFITVDTLIKCLDKLDNTNEAYKETNKRNGKNNYLLFPKGINDLNNDKVVVILETESNGLYLSFENLGQRVKSIYGYENYENRINYLIDSGKLTKLSIKKEDTLNEHQGRLLPKLNVNISSKDNITNTEEKSKKNLKNKKFALSPKFNENVNDILENNGKYTEELVKVYDGTPIPLQISGLENLPMYITKEHILSIVLSKEEAKENGFKVRKGKNKTRINFHALGKEGLIESLESLEHPLTIYRFTENETKYDTNNFIVDTGLRDSDNAKIIVPISANNEGVFVGKEYEDYNFIKSVYGKDKFEEIINKLLDENKIRVIYSKAGGFADHPSPLGNNSYVDSSIINKTENVNENLDNSSSKNIDNNGYEEYNNVGVNENERDKETNSDNVGRNTRRERRNNEELRSTLSDIGNDTRTSGRILSSDEQVSLDINGRRKQGLDNGSKYSKGLDTRTSKSDSGVILLDLSNKSSNEIRNIVKEAKENNKWGFCVDNHEVSEYDKFKNFTLPDGLGNVSVTSDGDIVAVVKNSNSKIKGAADIFMKTALANGGVKLDCYESLIDIYTKRGFIPVNTVEWNEEYAPSDWDYGVSGPQRVVTMMSVNDDIDKMISPNNGYKMWTKEDLDNLPHFDKNSYDEAIRARDNLIEQAKTPEGVFLNGINIKYSLSSEQENEIQNSDNELVKAMFKELRELRNELDNIKNNQVNNQVGNIDVNENNSVDNENIESPQIAKTITPQKVEKEEINNSGEDVFSEPVEGEIDLKALEGFTKQLENAKVVEEEAKKGLPTKDKREALQNVKYAQNSEKLIKLLEEITTNEEQSRKERLKQQENEKPVFNWWDKLRQQMFNSGHAFDKISNVTQDYRVMNNYNACLHSAQSASNWILKNQTDLYGNVKGKSVKEILEPIYDKDKMYQFSDYLYHWLNIDMWDRYKPLDEKISQENSRAVVYAYEKANPYFKEVANDVWQYYRNILDYNVASGLVSEDLAKKLTEQSPHYIPLSLEKFGDQFEYYEQDKDFDSVDNPIKLAKGGSGFQDLTLIDKQMIRSANSTVKNARLNILMNSIYDLAKNNSEKTSDYVKIVSEPTKEIEGRIGFLKGNIKINANSIVSFGVNGIETKIKMQPMFIQGINDLNSNQDMLSENVIAQAMAKGVDFFKRVHTSYDPTFIVRNAARDIGDALLWSDNSIEFVKKYPRAFNEVRKGLGITNKDLKNNVNGLGKKLGFDLKDINDNGETNSRLWDIYVSLGAVGDVVLGDYSNLVDKGVFGTEQLKKTKKVAKALPEAFEKLNLLIEQAPRFNEFLNYIEKFGLIEKINNNETLTNNDYDILMQGLYKADDITLNFQRGGKVIKTLNKYAIPFINPAVQDLSKFVRKTTAIDKWSTKDKAAISKAILGFTVKATMLGLSTYGVSQLCFAAASALCGDDDDRKKKLEEEINSYTDYYKKSHFLIPIWDEDEQEYTTIRIPKGRIVSGIANISKDTISALSGEESIKEYATNVKDDLAYVWEQISPFESTAIWGTVSQAISNKNYYGGDIVPEYMQDLDSEYQYDEGTTSIAKKLGKITGWSPMKIDYVMDQYSGVIGDVIMPFTTEEGNTSNAKDVLKNLGKKLIVDTVYSNTTSTDYYNAKEEIASKLAKQKTIDSNYSKTPIAALSALYKSNDSQLSTYYSEKEELYKDTSISNEERSKKLREIQKKINKAKEETMEIAEKIEPDLEKAYKTNYENSKKKYGDSAYGKVYGSDVAAAIVKNTKSEYASKLALNMLYETNDNLDDLDGSDKYNNRISLKNCETLKKAGISYSDQAQYQVYANKFKYKKKSEVSYETRAKKLKSKLKSLDNLNSAERSLLYMSTYIYNYNGYSKRYSVSDNTKRKVATYLAKNKNISFKQRKSIGKNAGFNIIKEGKNVYLSW